jgi:hypothetical protein
MSDLTWDDLVDGEPYDRPSDPHPATLHCLCGRFARWVGDSHYYNGTFDCYSYTVHCARCGDVTIECV